MTSELWASDPQALTATLLQLVRQGSHAQLTRERRELAKAPWIVTPQQAEEFVAVALALPHEGTSAWGFVVATHAVERAFGSPVTDQAGAQAVEQLLSRVETCRCLATDDVRWLTRRLAALLPNGAADVLDVRPISPDDRWGAAVRADLLGQAAAIVNPLLAHLASATGSKPSVGWVKGLRPLITSTEAADVLRALAERLADVPRWLEGDHGLGMPVVSDRNTDVARAGMWALIWVEQPWVVDALSAVAERAAMTWDFTSVSPVDKVGNAAILALGEIGTPPAIAVLQRLSGTTKNNGIRKRLSLALDAAAGRAGVSPSALAESVVVTEGFDTEGRRDLSEGSVRVGLELDALGTLDVSWSEPEKSAPTSSVAVLKRQIKAVRQALAAERRRLEDLLCTERVWEPDEWNAHYLAHPLSSRLGAGLLWRFGDLAALPDSATTVRGLEGSVPRPDGPVRLWHPATASTDEVEAWRAWMLAHELRQSFKQAFREIYLLTPAERETATYSNRFAAHVLQYQQMFALTKDRGWASNYLGHWDGGFEGVARRAFPDAGLTVTFEHRMLEEGDQRGPVSLATTDRVAFHRTADRRHVPVAVADVPPLVFSEAMRDVDLFVSVTSIALDPEWVDRQDDPSYPYWERTAFAPLGPTAEVRHNVLETLIPQLAIADRLTLQDRYLRVRGSLATYLIHLGTANIKIEPDDRYLCIVPSGRRSTVMLPFDDDTTLSLILSKALLLAGDARIKDPTILAQLPRRP